MSVKKSSFLNFPLGKKKFVEIVPHYPAGSTSQISEKENFLLYPARIMKGKGYDVEILTLQRKNLKEQETVTGIKVKRFRHTFSLLWYVLVSRDIALVHSFLRPFPPSLFVGIIFNKPRVITPITYILGSNNLIKKVSIFFMKMFDKVLVLTSYEHSIYIKNGLYKEKLLLLPFCIDYGLFSEKMIKKKTSLLGGYRINKEDFVIISVANFRKFKNLDIMLKAFKIFHNKVKKSRFLVVGKDLLSNDLYKEQKKQKGQNSIQNIVDSLDLQDSVTITGSLDSSKVRELFSASDIFVNVSDPEAQGIAVYEAAAAGMPLCLSSIRSFTTVFGNHALYCNPRNENELANNYLRYYNDRKLMKKNSDNLKKLMKEWDYRIIHKKLSKVYDDLLGR